MANIEITTADAQTIDGIRNALSAAPLSVFTTTNTNSAYWSQAYTNLVNNSAAYLSGFNLSSLASASGSWNSNYSTTNTNSASWNSVYSSFNSNSSRYTTLDYLSTNNVLLSAVAVAGNVSVTNGLTASTIFTTGSGNVIIDRGNFRRDTDPTIIIGANSDQHLRFRAGGATNSEIRMTILSSGEVGIGTSIAETAAAGNGGLRIKNNLLVDGNSTLGNVITDQTTIVGIISGNNPTTSFNAGSATGSNSFAANESRAFGDRSFAEGWLTIASGIVSHAEGYDTRASNNSSHAEGSTTVASGNSSHAEGASTVAFGTVSHAEGFQTSALGTVSHAEGQDTKAAGSVSHAAGTKATAAQDYTYAWSDANLNTLTANVSTTRTGQYMVSASGGIFFPGNMGIGTDSIANALTVVGTISTIGGNSNQWNSNYTTTNTNSANWSRWSSVSGNYALVTNYVKLSGDDMTGLLTNSVGISSFSLSARFIDIVHLPANDGTNPVLRIGEYDTASGNVGFSGMYISYNESNNVFGISAQFAPSAGIPAINIDRNANVGINTNSPSEKLTVSGNISGNGNLTVAGNVFGGTNINLLTSTTYIIQLSDNGGTIASSNSTAGLTAVPSTGITYPVGFQTSILQLSTARVALSSNTAGITINQANAYIKTTKQYSAATLLYTGTLGGWVLFGDVGA